MFDSFVILLLLMLGVVICASIIPVITVIWLNNVKNKHYRFSRELFEAEYPESHLRYVNEQYEKKKEEEFGKQLP